jgi:hypothetical protein
MKQFAVVISLLATVCLALPAHAETDILGDILRALSQPVQQQPAGSQQAPQPPPATASVPFHYCVQLTRQTQGYAFAMALFPDTKRDAVMPSGDASDYIDLCAGQVRHHLCSRQYVGLFGETLTMGRPGGQAVGTAANAAEPQTGLKVLGGVGGAVLGAAVTGKPVTGGAAGALAGYGAGSVASHAVSSQECERRKASLGVTAQRVRGSLRSNDLNSLLRLLDNHAQRNPADRAGIADLKTSARKLADSAATVLR